ncbi:MAG: D-alanine--D-alanine ligase [Chloroflexi bacterium]|nr:D-alanine--D-alanine ligase [Chloroflexota bacterium]
MSKLRVCVIFGGRSGEHEISLRSARSVLQALDPDRYTALPVGITHDGRWFAGPDPLGALEKRTTEGLYPVTFPSQPGRRELIPLGAGGRGDDLSFDLAFPVLHGTYGEDGTIQGLFEMADVPYVGAGVLGSSVGMDKVLFKLVMQRRGLPVVEGEVVFRSQILRDAEAALRIAEKVSGYPLFVKPGNLGSSVGVSKCRNHSSLCEGLMDAARYDRRVLVERGLEARELEVSVLGNEDAQASLVGEVVPSDEFYSYRAKYLDDTSELRIPAPIEPPVSDEIRRLAVECFKAIDGAGMARVDFLLERSTGKLYINEINTLPGFTSISMYPKLWMATGLTYSSLVTRLIELALERQAEKDALLRVYGGAG